jgi:hypothetical protein
MKETIQQAINMAKFSGIKLTPEQLEDYVFLRESKDREIEHNSDQVILDTLLNPIQTRQFREKFKGVDF